jgi:hypothetical protein
LLIDHKGMNFMHNVWSTYVSPRIQEDVMDRFWYLGFRQWWQTKCTAGKASFQPAETN